MGSLALESNYIDVPNIDGSGTRQNLSIRDVQTFIMDNVWLCEDDITKLVEELELNDISELKTYCSVARKLHDSFMPMVVKSRESRGIKDVRVSVIEDFIGNEMGIMTMPEYFSECGRTCAKLVDQDADELHMAMGVVTEAGEFMDAYKRKFAYGSELDVVNCSEEVGGDTMWYIGNWFRITGMNFYKSLKANNLKLWNRYPNVGFTKEDAINRDPRR